jgi:Gpi18-like mannosyltransferase
MIKADIAMFIKEYALYFLVFISLVFMSPPSNFFYSDMECWKDWITIISTNGISAAYDNGANYMPLFMYFLYGLGKIFGNLERFFVELYIFKGVILFFDFITVLFFVQTLFRNRDRTKYFIALFLNVSLLFNTYLWGQVDSVYTFFAILAVYFICKNKPIWAFLFLIISINLKLQGIIFVPLVVLVWLNSYKDKAFYKKSLQAFLVVILFQVLIVLPFILHDTFNKVIDTVLQSSGYYPAVSMNAFNIWMFFFPSKNNLELMHVSNAIPFLGITYKSWGLLLFFISSFIVLLPIFLSIFKKNKIAKILSFEICLLMAILLSLNFFYFNTEMHERYVHPAVVIGLAYTLLRRDYLLFFLVSISYTLNLEKCLHYLALKNYNTLVFDHRFIAVLWSIVMIKFYIIFYKELKNSSLSKTIQ